MTHDHHQTFPPLRILISLPSVLLVGAGITASVLAALVRGLIALGWLGGSLATFLTVVLLVSGLLLAGGGVWWELRSSGKSFEERARSAILVAAADVAVLAAYLAMAREWDSLRMALVVLWVMGLLAVPLVLLPSVGRRIAVSVLVLLHFGGILTATTAVELPNNTAPWVPTSLWSRVYRPYLTFMYLNNAYHFYSPEPGPPTLVWFLVEFEDGVKPEWVKLITRDQCTTRLQYQRLLALTESTNRPTYTPPVRLTILGQRFFNAAKARGIELPQDYMSDLASRYREPTADAKRYISSYVRHVARTVRSKENPDARIKSIKVYRIVHQLIGAPQLKYMTPIDPVLYFPYFQGEFDTDGKLKKFHKGQQIIQWLNQGADGKMEMVTEEAQDPFLYWLLPVYRVPINPEKVTEDPSDWRLLDCFRDHAGVSTGLEEALKRKKK
jgi:hypothetical protein